MSITAAPKRAYDQIQSSPELPPQHRLPMNALPSFDNLTNTPMAANTPPPAPHIGPQPMSIADRTPTTLPKVGQTRCYWSLLTPELQFLYLDPVLASHLSQQSDKLIGKSLLTFVHPDEQTSAERDLGSVLESRTLHGSVTRVRWARISSVRRQLGYQGPDEEWGDALKPGEDPNYMSIDVVINWAADGLVLCFMHAAKDKEARDNDENDKTHWSNWCGTPYLSVEQVQLLYDQLSKRVTPSPTLHRVFQVLLNKPERPLWLSWPPDPPLGQGPTSKEFARLAAEVQIGNSAQNGTDAKTSCTRRYKALQTMHMGPEGTQEVESIFIPYGSIIFACHRVNQRPTPIAPQSMYGANNHHGQQQQQQQQHYNSQYYEQTYSVPAVAPPNHGNGYGPPQSGYPSHTWPASGADSSSPSHSHWGPQGAPQAPPYMENGQSQYSYPPPAGQYQGRSSSPVVHDPPSPGSDVVPASRIPRRGNRERDNYANGRGAGNPPTGVGRCASCKVTHSPEWRKGPSGKKDLCNACGLRYARSRAKKEGSAQRRRKDRMINMATRDDSPSTSTAGSMYSASGGPPPGRPYDDTPYSANSASGSESYARHGGPPPPPGPSGSSASASGPIPTPSPDQQNFIPYSYAGHNQYTQKQSPSSASPPSRQIPPPPPGLPHQPQQSGPQSSSSSQSAQQQDQHYPVTTTQTQTSTQTQPSPFYSVPPPPPSHGGQIHHGSSVSASAGSSSHPRLDTYSSTRRSPGHSPASTTHSPVSTGFSAASFERDRHDRDREKERDRLPPTPDSADPRY